MIIGSSYGRVNLMPPKKKKSIYKLPEDERLKREAYGIAMYGTAEEYKDPEQESREVEGYNANYSDYRGSFDWPDSFEVIAAPTSDKTGKNDKRDRALECGYHHETQTLVVIFRAPVVAVKGSPNTYVAKKNANGLTLPPPVIMYPDIPVELWEKLKLSDSTGRFLRQEGIDFMGYEHTTMPGLHSQFS